MCVGGAPPAFAQERSQPLTFRQLAERLVDEVVANPFGMSRLEWRKTAPAATWIEFQGEDGYNTQDPPRYRWPDGRWCAIADDTNGAISRQAVFYGLRRIDPLDCRLEQLTYIIESTASAPSAELYGELVLALTKRIGDGNPARIDSADMTREAVRGRYGTSRDGVMHWNGGAYTLSLFTESAKVGLTVRHHELIRALETPSILTPLLIDATLQDKLLTQVRHVYPEIAEIMADQRAVLDQPAVVSAARTLLTARDRATSSNDRAWLSLAAEQVLLRLDLTGEQPPEQRSGLAELRPFGLVFTYDAHDDRWIVARGLSDAIIGQYPFNDWAHMALVSKILHGWDLVDCHDSYTETIKQGTDWLARNPGSPYRLAVTQAVAHAYETWWSLSKAPGYDLLASTSREAATAGAGRARLEAIAWYRRALELMPAGLPIKDIERAIIHLSVDIDTGQRRYHCAMP